MKMRIAAPTLLVGALFAAMTAVSTFALAADPKDTPAPVPAEPQNTSATYGDWILQCARAQDGTKICNLVQTFQIQGQQGVFAELIITRGAAKDGFHITFEMAPNVSFPSSVKLGLDDKDTQPLELSWRRCQPGAGCFADADAKDDLIKKWRAATGTGRLTFKDSTGKDQAIGFSFRGLPQALDGLVKG